MIPYMYETQSFNRYSYVQNNPLKYTDPTGHWGFRKVFKKVFNAQANLAKSYVNAHLDKLNDAANWVKENKNMLITVGVAIGVGVLTGGLASGLAGAMLSGALAGGAAGIVGARLAGASWNQAFKAGVKGAVIGAVSAGAAYGVGSAAQAYNVGTIGKGLMHATSRYAMARAQGQNGRAAFISSFVSSVANGYGKPYIADNHFAQAAYSAAVGGTVSELTGGKFGNGAATGAFIYMFNEALHDERQKEIDSTMQKLRNNKQLPDEFKNNARIITATYNSGLDVDIDDQWTYNFENGKPTTVQIDLQVGPSNWDNPSRNNQLEYSLASKVYDLTYTEQYARDSNIEEIINLINN
jgi:hypothetical protein